MCGIAGTWSLQERGQAEPLRTIVRRQTEALRHRGPDAGGIWLDEHAGLGLGHRRLSIVDLSAAGAQPMCSASERYVAVFNGEIYNFRELRAALLATGTPFRGGSDTEVLLACVDRDGVRGAIERCAGMFALAIWDRHEQELWLVRDRLGEKPLYWSCDGAVLAFGSELKAVLPNPAVDRGIDPLAIADVLERGYIRGDRSIHAGVRRLRPGTIARIRCVADRLQVEEYAYWSPPAAAVAAQAATGSVPLDTLVDRLDAILTRVVEQELVADVPVGAFLSGGIDSALITALMQKVATRATNTFTVGFSDARFDEAPYARAVAEHLGTAHTEVVLSPDSALTFVEELPSIFDEPFADSSQLPTLLVCRETRRHFTVALSGDGGDELFGGYSQYVGTDGLSERLGRLPGWTRPLVRRLLPLIPDAAIRSTGWAPNVRHRADLLLSDADPAVRYETLLSAVADPGLLLRDRSFGVTHPLAGRLAVSMGGDGRAARDQMAYDLATYLPDDILVKVDRAAMHVSLETRAPFLHHDVVEFAMALPSTAIIDRGRGKHILRALLARYLPPPLFERPKRGFAIPVSHWLRGALRPWGEAMLTPDQPGWQYLDRRRVLAMWAAHQAGQDHGTRLWHALVLLQWFGARAPQRP